MTRKQFAFTNDEGEFLRGEFPNVVKTYPLPDEVVTAAIDTLSALVLSLGYIVLVNAKDADDVSLSRSAIDTARGLRADLGFSPLDDLG